MCPYTLNPVNIPYWLMNDLYNVQSSTEKFLFDSIKKEWKVVKKIDQGEGWTHDLAINSRTP